MRGVFGSVDTANTLWRAVRHGPTAREARLGTIPASLMLIEACATSMCAGERGVHVSPVGRKGLASLLKPLAGMVSIRVGWPSPEAILTWSPRGDVACDEATATSQRGTDYNAVSQVTEPGQDAMYVVPWRRGARR